MAKTKNKIQSQEGGSLPQFLTTYGTEEQCRGALFKMRRPQSTIFASTKLPLPAWMLAIYLITKSKET